MNFFVVILCFCFFFQFVSASAVVETMSIFLASISHCRLNKIRGGGE